MVQIDIDPLSDVPLYQQLRDRIVEAVASGRLVPGEQLASVRQLAVAFGINVATVSKGYDLLRQEGFIRTNRKSGSVIARGPHSGPASDTFGILWQARLVTLLAEAVAQGMTDNEIVASTDHVLAGFAASVTGNSVTGNSHGGDTDTRNSDTRNSDTRNSDTRNTDTRNTDTRNTDKGRRA